MAGGPQQSSLVETTRQLEFLDPDSGIQEIVKVDLDEFMKAANRLSRHPSDRLTAWRHDVALMTSCRWLYLFFCNPDLIVGVVYV